MEVFPAFFPLSGQTIVIAGEGDPAEAKARLLASSPAQVTRLIGDAALDPGAYAGARLAFVASYDPAFRRDAAAAARAAGVLVNVADAPDLCDFHTPAIIDRGQLVAAIGTGGASPVLAALLRGQIEALVPEGAGRLAALLGAHRAAINQAFVDLGQRRAFLRTVIDGEVGRAAQAGEMASAEALLAEAIVGGVSLAGRITFIADIAVPDLVSMRAARVLDSADVIVAGPDAEAFLAHHGRRDAERLDGLDAKALAALAQAGRLVAVIGARATPALITAARAAGVTCDVLGPASAS